MYLATTPWTGFSIIGDNIDKNVNPSFQRLHYSTQSLHYFHSYACLDRIDFSNLDDLSSFGVINVRKACLTSDSEMLQLKNNFYVLVSRYAIFYMYMYYCNLFHNRVLYNHAADLGIAKHAVKWHIPFQFSEEMSLPSKCVSFNHR